MRKSIGLLRTASSVLCIGKAWQFAAPRQPRRVVRPNVNVRCKSSDNKQARTTLSRTALVWLGCLPGYREPGIYFWLKPAAGRNEMDRQAVLSICDVVSTFSKEPNTGIIRVSSKTGAPSVVHVEWTN